MTTLKDVAKYAGVSATTVSLVVNGKSDDKRVSESTKQRIFEAVKLLDYKPNLAARRLKNSASHKFTVALYWPSDDRTTFLARVLNGLYSELKHLDFKCDIVVCSFEKDQLKLESELAKGYAFDAAIIGAISKNDMKYLKKLKSPIPIILHNRELPQYASVLNTYDEVYKRIIADLLNQKIARVTLFESDQAYMASKDRMIRFKDAAVKAGIQVETLTSVPHYEGGYTLAKQWTNDPSPFIFAESDLMALGALRYFHEQHILVPDQVKILAVGLSEINHSAYTNPSLSILSVPTEQMSRKIIQMLYQILEEKQNPLLHEYFELEYYKRESY